MRQNNAITIWEICFQNIFNRAPIAPVEPHRKGMVSFGEDDEDSDDDDEEEEEESGGGGGYDLAEVAKHVTKGDCWVVVAGQVPNKIGSIGALEGQQIAFCLAFPCGYWLFL